MKNLICVSILAVAASGTVASLYANQSLRTVQSGTLRQQVISSAMPAPICGPSTCNIRGGN